MREGRISHTTMQAECCHPRGLANSPRRKASMPTVAECRDQAANYKTLAGDPTNSARRTSVLSSISRSWTALANQYENLALIVKEEG